MFDILLAAQWLFFALLAGEFLLRPDMFSLPEMMGTLNFRLMCLSLGLWCAPLLARLPFARLEAPFFAFPPGPLAFVTALVALDFADYWKHRWHHENARLWIWHVGHHQPEKLNGTVSLRTSSVQSVLMQPLVLVLPVMLGIDFATIAAAFVCWKVYLLFIHFHDFPRVPLFDAVFVTSRHHRLHHSVHPEHLNRNYGAVLVVWDRLFGTYVEDDRRDIRFGLAEKNGMDAHSFFGSLVHPWRRRLRPLFATDPARPNWIWETPLMVAVYLWSARRLDSVPAWSNLNSFVVQMGWMTLALYLLGAAQALRTRHRPPAPRESPTVSEEPVQRRTKRSG